MRCNFYKAGLDGHSQTFNSKCLQYLAGPPTHKGNRILPHDGIWIFKGKEQNPVFLTGDSGTVPFNDQGDVFPTFCRTFQQQARGLSTLLYSALPNLGIGRILQRFRLTHLQTYS